MKKFFSFLMAVAIVNLMFTACEKQDDGTPPELPPYESMAFDVSFFTDEGKAAVESLNQKSADEGTQNNFGVAVFDIVLFNTVLTAVLAVPVAAFANSFNQASTFLGEATWQWEYTVEGWFGKHNARLTGQVGSTNVIWKMYVSREGINPYAEFLWFEGTSALDGNSGDWLLYHSAQFQEELLKIDWVRLGDEIGDIKYTVVRELDNDRNADPGYGSYVLAGKTDAELDAFYTIYLAESSHSVFIEWSSANYNGRIKDESNPILLQNIGWNCWDVNGFDTDCP